MGRHIFRAPAMDPAVSNAAPSGWAAVVGQRCSRRDPLSHARACAGRRRRGGHSDKRGRDVFPRSLRTHRETTRHPRSGAPKTRPQTSTRALRLRRSQAARNVFICDILQPLPSRSARSATVSSGVWRKEGESLPYEAGFFDIWSTCLFGHRASSRVPKQEVWAERRSERVFVESAAERPGRIRRPRFRPLGPPVLRGKRPNIHFPVESHSLAAFFRRLAAAPGSPSGPSVTNVPVSRALCPDWRPASTGGRGAVPGEPRCGEEWPWVLNQGR